MSSTVQIKPVGAMFLFLVLVPCAGVEPVVTRLKVWRPAVRRTGLDWRSHGSYPPTGLLPTERKLRCRIKAVTLMKLAMSAGHDPAISCSTGRHLDHLDLLTVKDRRHSGPRLPELWNIADSATPHVNSVRPYPWMLPQSTAQACALPVRHSVARLSREGKGPRRDLPQRPLLPGMRWSPRLLRTIGGLYLPVG